MPQGTVLAPYRTENPTQDPANHSWGTIWSSPQVHPGANKDQDSLQKTKIWIFRKTPIHTKHRKRKHLPLGHSAVLLWYYGTLYHNTFKRRTPLPHSRNTLKHIFIKKLSTCKVCEIVSHCILVTALYQMLYYVMLWCHLYPCWPLSTYIPCQPPQCTPDTPLMAQCPLTPHRSPQCPLMPPIPLLASEHLHSLPAPNAPPTPWWTPRSPQCPLMLPLLYWPLSTYTHCQPPMHP